MVKKLVLTLLKTLLFCALYAEHFDSTQDNPVTNFKGAPSSMVNGCVNVITGDFTDYAVDISIPGPEPLTFERSYVSSDTGVGSLCHGWNKNHHETLELSCKRVQYTENLYKTVVGETSNYDSGLGVRMNYESVGSTDKSNLKYRVNKNLYLSGLTNCSGGELSGKTNHKNDRIYCNRLTSTAKVVDGSGTTHILQEYPNIVEKVFFLQDVIKRNRLSYHNVYNENCINVEMQQIGSKGNLISWIKRFYPKNEDFINDPKYTVTSSDGRKVIYRFVKLMKEKGGIDYYLKSVSKNSGPSEYYEYEKFRTDIDKKKRGKRVIKKSYPDNRYIEIGYWHKGNKKSLDGFELMAKGDDKSQRRRVAFLKQPVGAGPNPIETYSFHYSYDKGNRRGNTCVKNAYGVPTRYFYSKTRLDEIHYFINPLVRYCKEGYYWGPSGTFYENNLMSSTLCDEKDNIHRSHTNYYDERGNVIVERLFGNLTGDNPHYLKMMNDGTPSVENCEYDQTYYTYSEDGMNLRLSEKHGNTKITYGYHVNTNLLGHKFVYVNDSLIERQFFNYDDNGVMIQEVRDDGSSCDFHDMTSVTQRKITRVIPSSKPVGLPGEISHYYVDIETGRECLLKRIVNSYSTYGYLIKEEVYDSDNQLFSIREWKHNSWGKVLKETNQLGEITRYKYDSNGNKIYEQGPRADMHKVFVYDYSNRLVAEKEIYDNGQVLVKHYKYDYTSNKVSETDIYNNKTTYKYDPLKRLIGTTRPDLHDVNGRVVNQNYRIGFNIYNTVSCKIDPYENATHVLTNVRGQPTSVVHPDGTQERSRYNLDGTLREHTDKNGITTKTEYDYQKRPTRKSVYSANGEFLFETTTVYNPYNILAETDAAGNVTSYEYDGAGRLIRKCKGALETRFEYDSMGRVHREVNLLENGDAVATTKLYDLLDRVTEEKVENGYGELQSLTQTTYDCAGNKIAIVTQGQAGSSLLLQEFNAHGEVTKSTDAEGRVTVTQYRYDYVNDHGQHVGYRETTDPMGSKTIVIKNAHGKDCRFIKKNAFDATIQDYRLHFDSNDNVVARVETVYEPDGSTRELKTLWQFNSANHMIRRTEASGTPDQKELYIEYNQLGQKTCVTKPDGRQILYEYDNFGRLARYYSSNGDLDYSYQYDILNNPILVCDHVNNTFATKEYNANGYVILETLHNGLSIGFDYDPIGRQTALYLPDQSSFTYDFSGLYLKRITRKDKWDNVKYHHDYLEYDLAGKVTSAQLVGAAGTAVYEYDLLSRLRRYETEHWREVIAGFDEAGNITERTYRDVVGDSVDRFSYDDLYQLKSESGTANHTYKNDSVYNRTAKDGQIYRLNNLNQVLSDGDTVYKYDSCGNLINKTSTTESVDYQYDSLGRLTTFKSGDQKAEYTYDETNRRMGKRVYRQAEGSWQLVASERYLYQGKHEIGSVDDSGEIISLRVLGNGLGAEIGAAVALEIEGKTYVPLHDHRGNVTTLVDADSGAIAECYRYSAFGEEQIYSATGEPQDEALSPWRFSSKRYDNETGYVYFGQRYYNPKLGRWVTPDPIGFNDGPNLYAYVRNSPLTNFDLWGEYGMANGKRGYNPRSRESYYGDVFKQKDQRLTWDFTFEKKLSGPESQRYVTSSEPITEPMQPDKRVCFCNGIMNTFSDAIESAKHISRLAGNCMVNGVHNTTHGILNDLIECFFGLNFFRGTSPSKLIQQEWDDFFAKNGPDAVLLQFCHSQGAIHVRNALIDYPEELRKRIIVVAIAPAAYISPDICQKVHHYVSSRDFVPYFDVRGRAECKDTIHYLKAHEDAGIWDHSFNSPTYAEVIDEHYRRYKEKN